MGSVLYGACMLMAIVCAGIFAGTGNPIGLAFAGMFACMGRWVKADMGRLDAAVNGSHEEREIRQRVTEAVAKLNAQEQTGRI